MSVAQNENMKNQCGRVEGGRPRPLAVTFYGAQKSNLELYFQMASLFREVTRDKEDLATQWMNRILASHSPNLSGNIAKAII